MANKKKGFIAKMIEGPERSDSYARGTLPGNRWELGWDLFKSNTGKMIGLNALTLLFLLPVLGVILLRYFLIQYYAYNWPFSQNTGLMLLGKNLFGLRRRNNFLTWILSNSPEIGIISLSHKVPKIESVNF